MKNTTTLIGRKIRLETNKVGVLVRKQMVNGRLDTNNCYPIYLHLLPIKSLYDRACEFTFCRRRGMLIVMIAMIS